VERPFDARGFYADDAYSRQRIKGDYDPDGLFRANHPIEAS
jgi:hypothetical protein